jgi:hypothetical protein
MAGGSKDLDPALAARAPNLGEYAGLDMLGIHLRARRELLFDRFVVFWARQEETATWVRLERAADDYLARARQARRAAKAAARAEAKAAEAERASREAAESAEQARLERERAAGQLSGESPEPGPRTS